MAYNTSPTPCLGSLNQVYDRFNYPNGEWDRVQQGEIHTFTANDGTTLNLATTMLFVSYTAITTTHYLGTTPPDITDPWGVKLNAAAPNDGFNVCLFSTFFQLDAAHNRNATVKAHPELNNQIHDWHINNGTIPYDLTNMDFVNAAGLIGPATGFGTEPQKAKIYQQFDPNWVENTSIFPYGTEIICLGASDPKITYAYHIGWCSDYVYDKALTGGKEFCTMYALLVQSRKSTDPQMAEHLSGSQFVNTKIHNTQGSQTEFGPGVWHLRISGYRRVEAAWQNGLGEWSHTYTYGGNGVNIAPVRVKLIDPNPPAPAPVSDGITSPPYSHSYYEIASSFTHIGCVSLPVKAVTGTVNASTTDPIPAGNYSSGDFSIAFESSALSDFQSIFESHNAGGAIPDPVWVLDVQDHATDTGKFWNWDGGFYPTATMSAMSCYVMGLKIPGAKPDLIRWKWDTTTGVFGLELKDDIQLDTDLPYTGWDLEMCLLKYNSCTDSYPPGGGTPSGTPSGPYTPISRPNPCWVIDNATVEAPIPGVCNEDFAAEEVSTSSKQLACIITDAALVQRIYDNFFNSSDAYIDAWNTAGNYFPLDTGYSNGDQLVIVASEDIQQGPVRVGVDNAGGIQGIVWDDGTKVANAPLVKNAAMSQMSVGIMTYTCTGSPSGTPSGTPSSPPSGVPSSTQSPAPPVSPVGPITQPSPASYPTSGGSILLLHSDQNPPTCTTPTPADFFNNGLAATGTSRINHTFTSDMLSSVVLTNNAYNTIFYYLMDAAQNIDFLGSVTFYVDRDEPTGGITHPKGANWLPPYTAEWLGKNKPAPFDGSINACDEPSTGGGTNTNVLYPPPAPVPTYAISATTDHPNPLHNNLIHEGSLVSTFTITTTDVPDGTVLYWTSDTPSHAPVTANDFTDNTLQGSVTIIGNSAVITRQALADNLTEGPETFRLQLRTDSVTGYIVASSNYIGISDTSKTILPPPPTYAISVTTDKPGYNKSLSEGSYKATFVVTTTDVPDGTVLYWKTYTSSAALTNAQDFADNATQGMLTINGNTGTIIREAVADSITEGPESFRIDIHIDSFNGLIVAQSDWIGIEDTSQTPPPPPPPTYNIAGTTTHATYPNVVVDEASEATVTYNVTTTNVPDGTILYWTHEPLVNAPQPSDFKDGMDHGSVTIFGNSAIITRQIFADNTLEGPEVLRLELRTVSVTGSIVARSNFIGISDTSS